MLDSEGSAAKFLGHICPLTATARSEHRDTVGLHRPQSDSIWIHKVKNQFVFRFNPIQILLIHLQKKKKIPVFDFFYMQHMSYAVVSLGIKLIL